MARGQVALEGDAVDSPVWAAWSETQFLIPLLCFLSSQCAASGNVGLTVYQLVNVVNWPVVTITEVLSESWRG